MESIRELRAICQKTAHQDVTNVYMRFVCRFFSVYITRLLIPTRVTADQVSFAMILTGVLANLFFLGAPRILFLMGAFVLQLWYLLDCVDGEVARYRSYQKNQEIVQEKLDLAMTGAYWDYLNHYIVHGLVPLTASFGVYLSRHHWGWLLVGFVASIAQTLLLAVHDTKSRAFVAKFRKALRSSYGVGLRGMKKGSVGDQPQEKGWSLPKWIFVVMHYSCTYPTVMNVATIAGLLNCFIRSVDFRTWFLLYYGMASTMVFLGIAAQNLRNQGLDREFEEEFCVEARS